MTLLKKSDEKILQVGVVKEMGTFLYVPSSDTLLLVVNKKQTENMSPGEMVTASRNIIRDNLNNRDYSSRFGLLISILGLASACALGYYLSLLELPPVIPYLAFILLAAFSGLEFGLLLRNWFDKRTREMAERADQEHLVEVQKMSKSLRRKLYRKQIRDVIMTILFVIMVPLFFQFPEMFKVPYKLYSTYLLTPCISNGLCIALVIFMATISLSRNPVREKIQCARSLKWLPELEKEEEKTEN